MSQSSAWRSICLFSFETPVNRSTCNLYVGLAPSMLEQASCALFPCDRSSKRPLPEKESSGSGTHMLFLEEPIHK